VTARGRFALPRVTAFRRFPVCRVTAFRRFALCVIVVGAAGCAGAPVYTEAELEQRCVRDGGWWRPDDLRGGYCEIESDGKE